MRLLGPGEYAAMVAKVAKERKVGISTVSNSSNVLFQMAVVGKILSLSNPCLNERGKKVSSGWGNGQNLLVSQLILRSHALGLTFSAAVS